MDDVMRGIFAVMQTALKPDGEFDLEGMKKQVDFCIECGGHGLVFPVLGGEFQYLSEDEREQLIGVVVDAAAGRVPVVAGVAGPSKAIAVECTKGAVRAGADAVVAHCRRGTAAGLFTAHFGRADGLFYARSLCRS